MRRDSQDTLDVVVPIRALGDWVQVRQRLGAIPAVKSMTVKSLESDRAELRLEFFGSPEELQRTLVGDLLTVTPAEIWKTAALYGSIAVVHFVFRRQFLALSFDPDRAEQSGLKVRFWDFLFYALFGLIVTSFVQIGGVLMVFAYLIVPAVCANFLARGLAAMMAIAWLTATGASVAGLYVAYRFDLPTGAAIVCTLGAALMFTLIVTRFRKKRVHPADS